MCDEWRSGGVTLILTLFILIEQIALKTWRSCLMCNGWRQETRFLRCACIGERWFVWSTKGVGLYAQRLKWWKRSIRSYTSKNALYEQNVLSSHGLHRSTFGDERLNYRVRNGIGWSLSLWFRSYKAFSLYEPNIWSYQVTNFAHPEGYIALWVKITNRKEIIKIKSSTN